MTPKCSQVSFPLALIFLLTTPFPSWAQFETRSSSPVDQPISVATGDFNHDHKLDLAVGVWDKGQVAILLGNGDGTFQPATYYNIDSETQSVAAVAVADFDHDGNLDIAVADRLGQNISVLLGNGDGTFRPAVQFPTNSRPTDLIVGDFNHDGNPDLATCDEPYVSVLLGNGDGTFQAPLDNNISFCSQASGTVLGTADFNHDGKLDLAVVSYELDILLGNGDGTFQLAGEYPAGEFDQSLAVSDFNNDHKPDVAVSNGSGSQIYIFLGNGDGTFQSQAPFDTSFPGSLVAADVNGDGKTDLVFLSEVQPIPSDVAAVILGNGDGTFQRATYYQEFQEGSMLAVGDFNADHKPDLIVADLNGSAMGVLLNTGLVDFSPTTSVNFSPQLVGTTSHPHNVTLTNGGTTPLSIASISTKKPFYLGTATTCGNSVAPGENCVLSILFEPGMMGLQNGLLALSDNASTKPQVIELSGTGTLLTVSPTQLVFGSQKVGTKSSPQSVTVTNSGKKAVEVTDVSIVGTNPFDYSQTNTCGTQISPGATCTISITFGPVAKGMRTAAAEINGGNGVEWQGVSLTGIGD